MRGLDLAREQHGQRGADTSSRYHLILSVESPVSTASFDFHTEKKVKSSNHVGSGGRDSYSFLELLSTTLVLGLGQFGVGLVG